MTFLTPTRRWKPLDPVKWNCRAYGRKVMFETEGGMLSTTLMGDGSDAQLYLRAKISGRMLVEVTCEGHELLSELYTNEELDVFVDLDTISVSPCAELEVHFIPATNGSISIGRDVEVIARNGAIFAMGAPARAEPQLPKRAQVVEQQPDSPSVLSKIKMLF